MPNSIAKVSTYLSQIIDEVYKKGSVSAVLDVANGMIRPVEGSAGTVLIPSIAFDGGLANYDKTNGANAGTITTTWQPFSLNVDRGRKFVLDSVDSIEDAGFTLAHMIAEFMRVHVVPEIDAYRFSKYATAANTTVNANLTSADVEDALEVAITALADKEVPKERLKLFISNACYSALKQSVQTRRNVSGFSVVNGITYYDDIPVIPVPASRFYTTCTLASTGFTNGGAAINFMLIDSAAAVQVTKHTSSKLFTPDQNIDADGYLWRYRAYHDAFVPTNKEDGIYVHAKSV